MTKRSVRHSVHIAPSRQRGAVLLIGLILLVVLTLVGVSTMETTGMEHKMVANMSDRQVCFEAAERAVKIGEDWLNAQASQPDSSGGGSSPVYEDLTANWWNTDANWTSWSHASVSAAAQEAQAPIYVVENLASMRSRDNLNSLQAGDTNTGRAFYRVYAKGFGQRAANKCVIQTTYARRF